jgi:CHAD domain-containing protein
MSYRLKSGELPSQGLKRIFRQEIEAAVHLCRHPAAERGVTVHEVRKHLKKLRAAIRLAADEVGERRHRREDRGLREIGRLVSDLRDAQVRLQTLVQLRDTVIKRTGKNPFSRLEDLLFIERDSFSAAFAGWQAHAIPMLESVGERLEHWPMEILGWKQICNAVAKTYKSGQRRLAKTIKNPEPECFHRWRQRTKDLWYQLRILQPLNRLVLEEIANNAGTLGELLGRSHDFGFLLSRLENERGDKALQEEVAQLEKLIRKRSAKLQLDALELGRRFYAEPTKAFAKRISIFVEKKTRV